MQSGLGSDPGFLGVADKILSKMGEGVVLLMLLLNCNGPGSASIPDSQADYERQWPVGRGVNGNNASFLQETLRDS